MAQPTPILEGNLAQRVIPLRGPGRHTIALDYHAPGFALGLHSDGTLDPDMGDRLRLLYRCEIQVEDGSRANRPATSATKPKEGWDFGLFGLRKVERSLSRLRKKMTRLPAYPCLPGMRIMHESTGPRPAAALA